MARSIDYSRDLRARDLRYTNPIRSRLRREETVSKCSRRIHGNSERILERRRVGWFREKFTFAARMYSAAAKINAVRRGVASSRGKRKKSRAQMRAMIVGKC